MHFLSHYYVEQPHDNPLFVAGLGIPDLVSGFSRTYNRVLKNALQPENNDLQQIHKGILHHYAADKRFHNSPLFMQHLALATQSFIREGLNRERLRLSVIAHVAVELMIDRRILLEKEDKCVAFYDTLDKVDEKVLSAYFDGLSLQKEKENFLPRFRFFKERKFIFLFRDVENIVYGLNRVYNSVAQIEFTEEEKHKFLAALNNIDNSIRYSWQEILKA